MLVDRNLALDNPTVNVAKTAFRDSWTVTEPQSGFRQALLSIPRAIGRAIALPTSIDRLTPEQKFDVWRVLA